MSIVSKHNPLSHYRWGTDCDGWNLVAEDGLSVKLEQMPSGSAEGLHYHVSAGQFFFILKGEAVFEVEGSRSLLKEQEGIHIRAGEKHRIINESAQSLEFILCSQPATTHDRYNII
jgi:mannose-6-phosphate isomerase-like protein (cupin superfamily)